MPVTAFSSAGKEALVVSFGQSPWHGDPNPGLTQHRMDSTESRIFELAVGSRDFAPCVFSNSVSRRTAGSSDAIGTMVLPAVLAEMNRFDQVMFSAVEIS